MKKALVFAAFVLSGLGLGVGGPIGYTEFNKWLNAQPAPASAGGQAVVESLEKGEGWRLSRNGNGVVHEKAKMIVHLDNSPAYCLQQWKEYDEDGGQEGKYIKQYDKTDYSHIREAARRLKSKLLLVRFNDKNSVLTEIERELGGRK